MIKKSQKKIQKETTQEFFDKKKSKAFTFNAAPVNKSEARMAVKTKVLEQMEKDETGLEEKGRAKKRSAFMAKLYRDEDELDELKVLAGDQFDSEVDEEIVPSSERKREKKQKEKSEVKTAPISVLRIEKLKFEKGSVALFAVCEVHAGKYAIVNHTRNVKGYIDLKENPYPLLVGQLLVAQVQSVGTGQHNVNTSRNLNRKLQLTLDPKQINKGLSSQKATTGMVLQGVVESKEQKGYILNLGLKDGAKGFLKSAEVELKVGSLVNSVVLSVSSKLIKCEQLTETLAQKAVQTDENAVTINTLKPGYLVNAKVSKLYENGVELTFLGGMNGTVFADHLDKASISNYKVGEKVKARVISVDIASKTSSLSLLPHIIGFKACTQQVKVGQSFVNAKVEKAIFGDSYLIKIDKEIAMLHKSQIPQEIEEPIDEDSKILDDIKIKKKKSKQNDGENLLNIGQTVPNVRVKEFNFFDGRAILSMKPDLIDTLVINYDQVNVGDFQYAFIEQVNEATKVVTLKISEFVKGILGIEHMADHPLKVIPPKLAQVGKKIKVRVFSIDNRTLIFTKKDSLMKDSVPVHAEVSDVQQGSKIIGVIVGQTEFGFVVRSFGNVKGLLTFEEIKRSSKVKISDLKPGSIIKSFVLFNKKKSGLALTLDKKKARGGKKNEQTDDYLKKFGPTQEEIAQLKQTYSSQLKLKDEQVGKVIQWRCVESKSNYYIAKTVAFSEKKNKIAILPKCLIGSFGINLPLLEPEFTFEALVVEFFDGLAIIALKPELIALQSQVPKTQSEIDDKPTHFGFISLVSEKLGVQVRFFNGLCAQISVKDLQVSQEIASIYKLGQTVSVTRNKKDRLSLKTKVLHKSDPKAHMQQLESQIKAFSTLFSLATGSLQLKIGAKVKASVQLVKDYGLIVQIQGHPDHTGFIINEQKSSNKQYKVGAVLDCIVLDIDTGKKIADLSERLAETKSSKDKEIKDGDQKAIVELNKEQYLIVTFKKSRQQVGVCILNDFTQVSKTDLYAKYQVGSEIDVKVLENTAIGFTLTIPNEVSLNRASKQMNLSLEEGSVVSGPLRSKKGLCLFIQVGSDVKVPVIGRLHLVEASSQAEFNGLKIGDMITAKVLKKQQENGRTWIELTQRAKHLASPKLDESLLNILSLDTMTDGQIVEGIITQSCDINAKVIGSTPVCVQVSAFIRAQLFLQDVLAVEDLTKAESSIASIIASKFKVGQKISLTYNAGKFTIKGNKPQSFEKGNLVIVRFVKSNQGFGVTVQLDEKTFASIELCELTDEVTANVAQAFSERGVVVARIIDTDKKGRLMLSSRESVVDQEMWKLIKPDGSSAHFKTAETKRQQNGNLRNAILKYGAKLVINRGDLILGYVTNISKAGCFIQVGHNTSIRAGLNELSDKQDFDFQKEMPIGRVVVARITKTEQDNTRFHASLRQSLVVYGVNQIEWTSLKPEMTLSAIVLAVADGVAFGQLKGTYYKLKIKDVPAGISIGTITQVKLLKVVKDKLSAHFIQIEPKEASTAQERQVEHRSLQIFKSVEEEAQKDIELASKLAKLPKSGQKDIEQLILTQKNQTSMEEQIRDLEMIQELEEDQQMAEDDSALDEDSDADEMRKIIQQTKVHEDSSDDSEDDEESESDQEEEGSSNDEDEDDEDEEDAVKSSEDEEMASESSEEEAKAQKSKSGKTALRAQIQQEKEIRSKEASMRKKDGDQPQTISDFERLLVADQDQSYLWIQYMAFMLEKLDVVAARRVAERAVKSVSITAEADKLNIWIAYMNLENKFGTQQQLGEIVKRAVDVNDRLKVYMQLINIYRQSDKTENVEDIFKMLCKKNFANIEVWAAYIEFLFEVRSKIDALSFTPAKTILQRALQALPKSKHINIICKFGILEYKFGQPESGRTMFEGIVTNYPKRMDVWSIYMDMEVKYGGKENAQQARHLFERCLALEEIKRKPKKMKLVFRKFMEFESTQGNPSKLAELRTRVEQYLEKAFKTETVSSSNSSGSEEMSE